MIYGAGHPQLTTMQGLENPMTIIKRMAAALLIGVTVIFSGCGGGGGGGGGSAPLAPPTADLTGTWTVTESGLSNCPGNASFTNGPYQVTVTQTGNNLNVATPVGTFAGTIDGDRVKWTGSYPEDGGTTTITSMSLVVASDDNTFSGSSTWIWTDGRSNCSGNTQAINGTRMPGSGPVPPAPTGLTAVSQSSSSINLRDQRDRLQDRTQPEPEFRLFTGRAGFRQRDELPRYGSERIHHVLLYRTGL